MAIALAEDVDCSGSMRGGGMVIPMCDPIAGFRPRNVAIAVGFGVIAGMVAWRVLRPVGGRVPERSVSESPDVQ